MSRMFVDEEPFSKNFIGYKVKVKLEDIYSQVYNDGKCKFTFRLKIYGCYNRKFFKHKYIALRKIKNYTFVYKTFISNIGKFSSKKEVFNFELNKYKNDNIMNFNEINTYLASISIIDGVDWYLTNVHIGE